MDLNEQDFKMTVSFIQQQKGIDLSSYRRSFLLRRLRFRMQATESKSCLNYIELIKKDNAEFNRLLDSLAINVSEFFRDPEVFNAFSKLVLPEIIQRKKAMCHRVIRVWSCGCASGEEAYSLAILIKEALAQEDDFLVRIWGTDMDNAALEEAVRAEYRLANLKEISKEQLKKYFISLDNDSCKLKEEIRQMVKFMKHNIIVDPPLKSMDIIFCRNVMIYLNRQQQDVLFKKFNRGLNSKGYLVIGKVEFIWGDLRNLFIPVESHQKIYQKVE
jgi:chemotaxis protein methyltransferase CheR